MSDPRFENIGTVVIRTIEELSELIHILCKIDRFGADNYHPEDTEKTPNWKLALSEIEDVEKRISELKKFLNFYNIKKEKQ